MSHRPLWISNFTKPSSRIFNRRDWQVSSFTTLARFMISYTLSGFSRSALRIFSRSFSTTRLLPSSSRAKSLRIRKLIFRNDSLDILRLALDTVSKTSICLDGHKLNDGVNHWWISYGASLWTLRLVANVFIQLIGIWHLSTSKSYGCSSVDHAVMQCML